MSIATQIQRIQEAKADIKEAIENKGVAVSSSLTISDYAPLIDSIPTGTTEVESKDVDFYDYDGTRLYSYTKQEFLALNEMPANPTHDGLTSQGWNWTLADAKEYVSRVGGQDIGQLYVTDDNSLRVYVHLEDARTPYCCFSINGTAIIDWGDGTSDTVVGTSTTEANLLRNQHTYVNKGDYVIKIKSESDIHLWGISSGCPLFTAGEANGNYNCVYLYSIYKIELSSNVVVYHAALSQAYSLESVTVPRNLNLSSANSLFANDYSLKYLTISPATTTAGVYMLQGCETLRIVSMPKELSLVTGGGFMQNDYSMTRIFFPANIISGNGTCQRMRRLSSIKLDNASLNRGSNIFADCYGMKKYDFTLYTSVPTIRNVDVFTNIPSDCKIVVPDSLYDTWIVATNWSEYASHIVKESEYVG